jgi:hypothetical protein
MEILIKEKHKRYYLKRKASRCVQMKEKGQVHEQPKDKP